MNTINQTKQTVRETHFDFIYNLVTEYARGKTKALHCLKMDEQDFVQEFMCKMYRSDAFANFDISLGVAKLENFVRMTCKNLLNGFYRKEFRLKRGSGAYIEMLSLDYTEDDEAGVMFEVLREDTPSTVSFKVLNVLETLEDRLADRGEAMKGFSWVQVFEAFKNGLTLEEVSTSLGLSLFLVARLRDQLKGMLHDIIYA